MSSQTIMYSDVLVLDSDVEICWRGLSRVATDGNCRSWQRLRVTREGKMQAKYRQRRLTICRTVNQGNGKRISEWVTEYAGRGGTGYVFAIGGVRAISFDKLSSPSRSWAMGLDATACRTSWRKSLGLAVSTNGRDRR